MYYKSKRIHSVIVFQQSRTITVHSMADILSVLFQRKFLIYRKKKKKKNKKKKKKKKTVSFIHEPRVGSGKGDYITSIYVKIHVHAFITE